ncbi:MAG: hypothetical protein ACRDQH_02390 [Pseudonocardiaceae bacterium]
MTALGPSERTVDQAVTHKHKYRDSACAVSQADPGPVPPGTAPAYPVDEPVEGVDDRFTFGLTLDVARVLADHGYPDMSALAADGNPADFVDLQQALFRFIYGSER